MAIFLGGIFEIYCFDNLIMYAAKVCTFTLPFKTSSSIKKSLVTYINTSVIKAAITVTHSDRIIKKLISLFSYLIK